MTEGEARQQLNTLAAALIEALTYLEERMTMNAYDLKKGLRSGSLKSFQNKVTGPQFRITHQWTGSLGVPQSLDAVVKAMNLAGDADCAMDYGDFKGAVRYSTKALDVLAGAGIASVKGRVTAMGAARRWFNGFLYASEVEAPPVVDRTLPVSYPTDVDMHMAAAEQAVSLAKTFVTHVQTCIACEVLEEDSDCLLFLAEEEKNYLAGYVVGYVDILAQRSGEPSGAALSQRAAYESFRLMRNDVFGPNVSFKQLTSFLREDYPPQFRVGLVAGISDAEACATTRFVEFIHRMQFINRIQEDSG